MNRTASRWQWAGPRSLTAGFSLLEILLVLAIMGAMVSVILPNIPLTPGSQISLALREFTTTIRATYDAAVLTGRIHRIVVQPRTGAYWIEAAPAGFSGRPPIVIDEFENAALDQEARAKLLEELEQEATEPRRGGAGGDKEYGSRSILVIQRKALKPVKWNRLDDAILYKRALPGDVVFASVHTETMREKMDFERAEKDTVAHLYFFPSGETQASVFHFTLLAGAETIAENGPKFSVTLDSLTGNSSVAEGFAEAEFRNEETR